MSNMARFQRSARAKRGSQTLGVWEGELAEEDAAVVESDLNGHQIHFDKKFHWNGSDQLKRNNFSLRGCLNFEL